MRTLESKKHILFSALLVMMLSLHVCAQEALDKSTWKELKEKVDYSKTSDKKKTSSQAGDSSAGGKKSPGQEYASNGSSINLGGLAQVIVIVLFVVLIVGILYVLLNNVSLKGTSKVGDDAEKTPLESIEDNFTKSNLDKWLQHAIDTQDYYLMVRIHFLIVLKTLENFQFIRWKKNKTNWHYIQDLDHNQLQPSFQELVYAYDKIWYGEKDFSEQELQQVIAQFESFKSSIKEGSK